MVFITLGTINESQGLPADKKLFDETFTIPPNSHISFNFTYVNNTDLDLNITFIGGVADSALTQIRLVDESNYQLFVAEEPYSYIQSLIPRPTTSGSLNYNYDGKIILIIKNQSETETVEGTMYLKQIGGGSVFGFGVIPVLAILIGVSLCKKRI